MDGEFGKELRCWIDEEKLAIKAIAPIHELMVDRSVELLLFRRVLTNLGYVGILKRHYYARQISQQEIGIEDTLPVIETLSKMPLCPSRLT